MSTTLTMIKELARTLECPVCFEFFNYPVFTCVVGHLICNQCRKHLTSCPLCRETFTGTRSFIAEQSVTTVTEFLRSASSETRGVNECDSKTNTVRCCLAVNGCKHKLMDSSFYIKHLKDHHAAFVAKSTDGSYTHMIAVSISEKTLVKRGADRLFILTTQGKSYVINMIQVRQEVRIWAFTEISPLDTAQRKVEISILDANNNKRISWTGPVNPIQVTDQSVGFSGKCLKTTTTKLKEYLHNDNGKYWKVHVKILNSQSSSCLAALAKMQHFLRQHLGFQNLSVMFRMGFCIFASILFVVICI